MLQTIRDRATGWIAYIIVGLLIIPFALWGVNSYFSDPAPLYAAEVGDSKISLREYQQAYQRYLQRMRAILGDNFDPAILDESRLKQDAVRQLVRERLLAQAANDQGFRISDERLLRELTSMAVFQSDGVFDSGLYERVLLAEGLSRQGYEDDLRVSMATDQLQSGLTESAVMTKHEQDRLLGLLKQKRKFRYLLLSLEKFRDDVSVDDTAIESYFEENKDNFLSPEQVKLQYLELDLERLAADVPITDAELRTTYEEQIVKYKTDEQRKASHILVKTKDGNVEAARARAQQIYDEIASNSKTFDEAMAEAQSSPAGEIEGGELGVISKDLFDDPAFGAALYRLEQPRDVSEPVQTKFGFHVIRLDGIEPERVKGFEEVKDELARELRLQKAEGDFYELVETLGNLSFENPDHLEPAAEALGLEIQESHWLTRDASGGEGILAYPEVIRAAFSEDVLAQGLNSEPIEVEPDHVLVMRVESHQEASQRSLEDARDEVVVELKNKLAEEALREQADSLLERLWQGEDIAALAEELAIELKQTELVERSDPEVDQSVLTEAFRLPTSQNDSVSVGITRRDNGDRAVIVLDEVVSGNIEDLDEGEREALARQWSSRIGSMELRGFLDSLSRNTEVKIYTDRL
jgi:peptidyl-prolyl cis-trans isomerase D